MSLFRSEDAVRSWSDFNSETASSIKPVHAWAAMMTGARIVQRRLDDDFVAKSEEYANELLSALAEALS